MSFWYLIQAKPKQESRAVEHLENQGVECFYPTIELDKIIRGRRQKVVEPLFANYIFIRLDEDDKAWSKIRSTRGVRDFVRFGLQMAKVPQKLIDSVRNDLSDVDSDVIETNAPKSGEKVKIIEGAFKDFEGVFKTNNGDERSIILLNVLNKLIEMDLSNKQVVKLTK